MQNAAIFFHPDAFDTTTGRLLGRHSAGESFLRGFMRHAEVDRFHFWNSVGTKQTVADDLVGRIGGSAKPLRWIAPADRAGLRDPGVLSLPGPALGEEAWRRRSVGANAYGICGLTHTTATARVMSVIADLLIAPTEAYDGADLHLQRRARERRNRARRRSRIPDRSPSARAGGWNLNGRPSHWA